MAYCLPKRHTSPERAKRRRIVRAAKQPGQPVPESLSNQTMPTAEVKATEQPSAGATANDQFAQFAYIAAHNLKEPLRSIGIHAGRLEMEQRDALDDRGREAVSQILEGVHRMSDLVDDLFAYSQVDSLRLEPAAVRMELVLSEALFALQGPMQESGVVVTHQDLPVVWGDQLQLTQLMENLLANSIKFRSAEPPRIHVSAQAEGGDITVRVQDNGIGIDPAYREAVFKLFKRLHARDKYPGNGVGLAICRSIVTRHGGRIWVESGEGAGATFCFTLPSTARAS